MDEWMDGWMDGWMTKSIDTRIKHLCPPFKHINKPPKDTYTPLRTHREDGHEGWGEG